MLGWVEVKVAEDVTTWSCNDSDFKILLTGSVVSSQGQVVEQLPQPLLKFNMMGYGMGSEEFGYNTSDPKVVYPRQGTFWWLAYNHSLYISPSPFPSCDALPLPLVLASLALSLPTSPPPSLPHTPNALLDTEDF